MFSINKFHASHRRFINFNVKLLAGLHEFTEVSAPVPLEQIGYSKWIDSVGVGPRASGGKRFGDRA